MTQKNYLKSLIDGSGHLNQYPQKKSEKHPDYGGFIKVENKVYRISAWIKIKNDKKFLSLKISNNDIEIPINEL